MSENLLQRWTQVTAALPWAKQRVLHDTLSLVATGDIKVVYGADSFVGSPCLINAVGCMVKSASEAPMSNEPILVSLFDKICKDVFAPAGIVASDSKGFLTELAAEILLRNFAPLSEAPEPFETPLPEVKYHEPKDADFQKMLEEGFKAPSPTVVTEPIPGIFVVE